MDPDAAAFLRSLAVERNLTPYTVSAYGNDLRDLSSSTPDRVLRELSHEDLRNYLEALQRRGLEGSTIRRRLATIRVFYRFLEAEQILPDSPANRLRYRFRTCRKLPRVMPISHVEALLRTAQAQTKGAASSGLRLRAARARRDLAILDLLFATGMRSGEVVALDLRDVDMERRIVHVKGKGRRERNIYVSSPEVLRNIQEYLDERHLFAPKENALFVNPAGQRLHVQSIRHIFRRAQRNAGTTGFSPHCLRHTLATMLVENGADLRSTQEILGHSNIKTTEIYVSVSRARHETVMARFNPRDRLVLG